MKTMNAPSHAAPGAIVGAARRPIAVRSGVAGLTFASAGLGSEVVKISKPVVRAMSAAVYQLLPSAIQSPGAASFSICSPFFAGPRTVLMQRYSQPGCARSSV